MILRRLLLSVAAVAVAVCVSAQNVFMVQGHERPDITARMAQMPARAAADEAVEDTDFSFDDIEFWVGTGSDSAALVIDWYDDKGGTLVWGYLFDAADDVQNTGYAMVAAVAKADPRFVLLTHNTNLGNTIAGLGYDLNGSGDITLIYTDPDTEETAEHTPVDGIVTTDAYNYDDWTSSDPDDHWVSGWYNGYWSYQVKESRNASFSYSGLGASSRRLQNGSWDGWAYQGFDNPSMTGVIPRAPWTAAEPPVQLPEGEEPTDGNTYWGQMYKNSVHQSIEELGMANKAENLSVKWSYDFTGYSGQPIIAGDYMYITEGKKIHKVSIFDGTAVLTGEMSGSMGFFAMITYGDGKIFVPYSNGSLEAFDAVTLKPLWKTEETGMQQLCPVVYHDGYVYTGQWKTIGKGKFYCISTADDDPLRSDEVKAPVWESDDAGFYWSGATVVGDNIY
ncbi:MAG: PQQ-binding-like beta-propeller repeat protein, partial [bacterium]|nr:PQQ-binding-like beta-propeller repeat protein [Candidatus Aphodosoma intestinipullorum]